MLLVIMICSCISNILALQQNSYSKYSSQQSYSSNPIVPIVSESNELNPDGTFSYSYATGDGQNVQAQGYLKNAGNKNTEAEVIQGSYSYTAPDGTVITVTYIADEFGFRAEGSHLPTPPPIPVAIQRSLDIIAKAQGRQEGSRSGYPENKFYRRNFKPGYNRPVKY